MEGGIGEFFFYNLIIYYIQPRLLNKELHYYCIGESFNGGVSKVNKYQKRYVYISIVALAIFLVFSLITQHWGFLLWSLLPVFMVVMTAFSTKINKKSNEN